MNEILSECLDAHGFEGTDVSLFTGLDWQKLVLYGKIRNELAKKYPKPKKLREEEDDIINIQEASKDSKAHLFLRALDAIHTSLERIDVLQHMASEYEKKAIRLYSHFTRNWTEFEKEYMKFLTKSELYEIVESYFRILRKHGLSTDEEPYYFLTPKYKRQVKIEGDMLKRSTQIDDSEIKVSFLESFL